MSSGHLCCGDIQFVLRRRQAPDLQNSDKTSYIEWNNTRLFDLYSRQLCSYNNTRTILKQKGSKEKRRHTVTNEFPTSWPLHPKHCNHSQKKKKQASNYVTDLFLPRKMLNRW